MDGDTRAAEVVLSVIEKRVRLLGLDRVADGSETPGGIVDGAFWEHVREAHDGKMLANPRFTATGTAARHDGRWREEP